MLRRTASGEHSRCERKVTLRWKAIKQKKDDGISP